MNAIRSAANLITPQLMNGEYTEMDARDRKEKQKEWRGNTCRRRLLDRDAPFGQSVGRWNIKRIKTPRLTWALYFADPFHSLVNSGTPRVITTFAGIYVLITLIYAALYMAVDSKCKLSIHTYLDACYFSIETLMTIGYGAQGGDIFFNGCYSPFFLILSQSIIGIFIDTAAIGIVFQRLSRAQSRAVTIIFTEHACIRRIRGNLYFMFQVCELRKHQLVEAHVRLYAIRKEKQLDSSIRFQSYPLRLQHPNDETGALLLMSLPSVVVHRIDAWSALLPPTCSNNQSHDPSSQYLFPDIISRAADVESGNRETHQEEKHTDENTPLISKSFHRMERDRLLRYWEETEIEVVVLVEGIDAPTSATVQARHSYKPSEMIFDHCFANCVSDTEGPVTVDFTKFHDLNPTDFNTIQVSESYC